MNDPWYKSTFEFSPFGLPLSLQVPHDVFSTQRIDEGSLLLLSHLPQPAPNTVLDMGCGYGALGLPIAARFPDAKVEMVDRDLLPVKWSQINAAQNGIRNVEIHGSLGFQTLNHHRYDWILCNVPARIGDPFIENLMELSSARLNPDGELRVVVINDLCAPLLRMSENKRWPLKEIVKGPRHTVYSLCFFENKAKVMGPSELYLRDEVSAGGLNFCRPFDFGGDDQKRLKSALPVLFDALPRQVPPPGFRVLSFRSGYGQVPLVCKKRWPGSDIVAIERDLLGAEFMRINLERLELPGNAVEIREAPTLADALKAEEKFDLILGELSASAGLAVALQEMTLIEQYLEKNGEALILSLEKLEKDWIRVFAAQSALRIQKVLTRESYSVVRFSRGGE